MHGQQLIARTLRCMLPAADGVIVLANTCTGRKTSEGRSGGNAKLQANERTLTQHHLRIHLDQMAGCVRRGMPT